MSVHGAEGPTPFPQHTLHAHLSFHSFWRAAMVLVLENWLNVSGAGWLFEGMTKCDPAPSRVCRVCPLPPGHKFLPVYNACTSFMTKPTELKPIISIIKLCLVLPLKQHCTWWGVWLRKQWQVIHSWFSSHSSEVLPFFKTDSGSSSFACSCALSPSNHHSSALKDVLGREAAWIQP